MRRIINTFKFGDKKVKRSLALAIFAGVVTVAFGVLTLVMANMLCFFIAIMAAFVTVSLVQTFMIAEGENPTEVKPAGERNTDNVENTAVKSSRVGVGEKAIRDKSDKTENSHKTPVDETAVIETLATETSADENLATDSSKKKQKSKKEKTKKEKTKKNKKKKSKKETPASPNMDDNTNQASGASIMYSDMTKSSDSDEIQYTDMTKSIPDEDIKQQPSDYSDDEESYDNDLQSEEHKKKETKHKVITEATAAKYTKKKIKQVKHKYKVIKDHRMVIVDRSDRYHIHQTPAYIWVQNNQLHILLIEEEPRLLMVPQFRITEISYLKKQPVDEEKDYKLFKKNTILTDCFRPYLPDYNHSNKTADLSTYKNLYGINQGIYFTNNSAKNLFDLLGVDFYVEDKVTTSNKVNIYFKEVYKANIKLRDNILDANGYAESITKTLDDMARSSISHAEFKETLNLMIRNKLITDEYASHYMDVRNSYHG